MRFPKDEFRFPYLTLLFVIVVGAVFVWQGWLLGHFAKFSADELLLLGGNLPPLSLGGEPWRLVSNMFLHESVEHVLSNAIALLVVGGLLESLVRRWMWLIIFLVGGIAASFATACVHYDDSYTNIFGEHIRELFIGVGASGAIMSLSGATIALGILQKLGLRPTKDISPLLRNALVFAGLNLVYGFTQGNVDNIAHIAGLVFGMICGLVLLTWHMGLRRINYAMLAAACLLIVASAATQLWGALPQAARRASVTEAATLVVSRARDKHRIDTLRAIEKARPLAYVDTAEAAGTTIPLPGVTRIVASARPDRVYLATNEFDSRILEYDLVANRVVRTIAVVPYEKGWGWGCPALECSGVGISDMVVDADNGKIYASTLLRGSISRVDAGSGHIDYTVRTGSFPSRLVLNNGKLYAYDRVDNTISVVDAVKGVLERRVNIPGKGDESEIYVWPHGQDLVLSPDRKSLYMQTPEEHVARLDLSTLQATLLPPAGIAGISRTGHGDIRLLGQDGIYDTDSATLRYAIRYRPGGPSSAYDESAMAINALYTDPSGADPLILCVVRGGAVVGISPQTGDVLRSWPTTSDAQDEFAMEALDTHRVYLPGRDSTQVLTVERSMPAGDIGELYAAELRQSAQVDAADE